MIDYNYVPARHDAIDARLVEWSRWVKVRPQTWKMQPMWRNFRPPKQYETEVRIEINTLAAHEIEKAVSILPEKVRTAIRWVYVYPGIHPNMVRRHLGLTTEALCGLIHDGRVMLVNRLLAQAIEQPQNIGGYQPIACGSTMKPKPPPKKP
jgi:hypothetical protein